MGAGQVKQALEKEVTCSLCQDTCKKPNKLPCDHIYCKKCLKGLALRSLDKTISCPKCQNDTDIPKNDVNEFPSVSDVNHLDKDSVQEPGDETDQHRKDASAAGNPNLHTCVTHNAQPLVLYCETCKTKLCLDCAMKTKEHDRHELDYIEKVAKKYRKKHENRLQLTKGYGSILSQVQPIVSEAPSVIVSKEKINLKEIDHAFDELHKTLEKSKQAMMKQLFEKYQSALNTALENKRQIEEVQVEIAHVTTLVEAALEGQDEALFIQEEQIENDVKKLRKRMDQFVSTAEPSLPVPQVMSCEMLQKQLDVSNFFDSPADPKKCRILDLVNQPLPGQIYTLTVNLVNSKGNRCWKGSQAVTGELCSLRDHTTTAGVIQHRSPGSINVSFKTPKRGRNEVQIMIRGSHIRDSPKIINFLKPLSQFSQPIKQVGSLERPAGLTTCGDSLLAVEYSRNRILKYNTAFTLTAEYGGDKLKGPIALTRDRQMNIYVTTVQDHKVHKFTCNGTHVKSIGTKGMLPGQFNFPMGLCVNSREELYVCDSRNNRVQVLDLQLKFKRMLGGRSEGRGSFWFPSDVAFDGSDNVYVCDSHSYNNQIRAFTPNGESITFRFVGNKHFGSEELPLPFPLNVCIFNDLLYVTQTKQNHITVLKTTGELVKRIGQGVLQQPEGIEVDADGYVYVSSHRSRIFVF